MTSEHSLWIRLGVDFEKGGNRSGRRKPSKSGWDGLKLNRQTTFVVEVEGVIDFQRVQHWKSIQMVTHPDINPIQQGLTSVNRPEPVFPFGASRTRRVGFGQSRLGWLITNSVYTWVSEWHICISESLQETHFYASHIHEFKNWVLSNKLIKVELPPWKI